MSVNYENECLCKKCFVKLCKPSKKDIKKIVLTEYDEECDNCHRVGPCVEYLEDGD